MDGGGASKVETTNNRMELQAMIDVLKHFSSMTASTALVFLDSEYVRKGLNEWLPNWKKRSWLKSDGQPVVNRDLWEELDRLYPSLQSRMKLKWVPGHEGVVGNERVDEIAVAFSKGETPQFHVGSAKNLKEDIFLGLRFDQSPQKKATTKSKKTVSGTRLPKAIYLSVVAGVLQRHLTWTECENRVKGQSGAKFKKVSTVEEETTFLDQHGKNKK